MIWSERKATSWPRTVSWQFDLASPRRPRQLSEILGKELFPSTSNSALYALVWRGSRPDSPRTKVARALDAYSRGVNAFIEQHHPICLSNHAASLQASALEGADCLVIAAICNQTLSIPGSRNSAAPKSSHASALIAPRISTLPKPLWIISLSAIQTQPMVVPTSGTKSRRRRR